MPRNDRQGGFTLIEVLVALAVIAIAMGALIRGVSANAGNAGYLREKTLAHWVAMNKITERQVMQLWPSTGTESGGEEMAGHEWLWTVTTLDSGIPDVRRIEVEVRAERDSEQALIKLVALLRKP